MSKKLMLVALGLLPLTGCMTFTGGGKAGIGWASTNELYLYQAPDGDKTDKQFKSELNQDLLDLIDKAMSASKADKPSEPDAGTP